MPQPTSQIVHFQVRWMKQTTDDQYQLNHWAGGSPQCFNYWCWCEKTFKLLKWMLHTHTRFKVDTFNQFRIWKKNNVERLMLSICDTMFTLCDSDRTWQLTLVSVVIWERFQTNKQFVRGTLIWTLRRYISDPCTVTLMLNLGSVQMMKAKPKQIQWDIWKDSHTG